EWQSDPARPDPQLEPASSSSELDEDLDDRVDLSRLEHLGLGLIVPRGDALVEVAIGVTHGPNLLHAATRAGCQPVRAAFRLASARRSASRRSRSTSLVSRYVIVEAIARWPAVRSIRSCISCATRR